LSSAGWLGLSGFNTGAESQVPHPRLGETLIGDLRKGNTASDQQRKWLEGFALKQICRTQPLRLLREASGTVVFESHKDHIVIAESKRTSEMIYAQRA
jgi:hypothetical protein